METGRGGGDYLRQINCFYKLPSEREYHMAKLELGLFANCLEFSAKYFDAIRKKKEENSAKS